MSPSGTGSLPSRYFDRYVVSENRANIVEVACFVGYGDHLPVTVSGWDLLYEGRGGLLSRGMARYGSREGDNKGPEYGYRNEQERDSFQNVPSVHYAVIEPIPGRRPTPSAPQRTLGKCW